MMHHVTTTVFIWLSIGMICTGTTTGSLMRRQKVEIMVGGCNPSGKTKRSKEFGQSDGVRVTGDKLMCDQQLR